MGYMIFYLGLNPRYERFAWLPRTLNVMFSAGGFWTGTTWRRDRFWTRGLRFLDSGGFTLLNKYGEYPFTIANYLNLVAILTPNYYASMDYPCEPDISRTLSHLTNEQRIRATVENARIMADRSPLVDSTLVPIIQGFTLDEYKHCIDLHHRHNTIRPYMAVGSMCRRLSTADLHSLIPSIAEYALQAGCTRLHWFGLKLNPALTDLARHIHSRDSAAKFFTNGATRFPRGQQAKRLAIETFLSKVAAVGLHATTNSRGNSDMIFHHAEQWGE
jgi:hypothetical protein